MIKFSLVRFFQKIKFSISKSNFNWKDKVFSYLIHDYDEKPEGVERKGLLGPSDGNAGRIRLKTFRCQDGIPRKRSEPISLNPKNKSAKPHLADMLTYFRRLDIKGDRSHVLKTFHYFLSS